MKNAEGVASECENKVAMKSEEFATAVFANRFSKRLND